MGLCYVLCICLCCFFFCSFFFFCLSFFSSRRRHTRCLSDWSSDVCSSDLIRATHDGKMVELVICFQCSQFYLHEGGKSAQLLINEKPGPTFNKVLEDAGIPIAK